MKQQIWHYLLTTLSQSRKELGGHAVCPFVKGYKDKILVLESQNPENIVSNFANFHESFGMEAIVVYGFDIDFNTLDKLTESWNKKYHKKDVECLFMDPDAVDPPLPVEYIWRECPLIIIQRRSTLEKHRRQLKEKSDYYTYFNGDD